MGIFACKGISKGMPELCVGTDLWKQKIRYGTYYEHISKASVRGVVWHKTSGAKIKEGSGTTMLATDEYKGVKIARVNTGNAYFNPKVLVKYAIEYKGVTVYFKTQKELKAFIDRTK